VTSNSSTAATLSGATEGRFRVGLPAEVGAISWPEHANPDPKDSISISEPRVPVGAKGDVKLMAKDEILTSDVTTRPSASTQGAKKQKQDFEHSVRLAMNE